MFSPKCKFHVLERKILISLSHQNFFIGQIQWQLSHGVVFWVVLLNLTIFWVRENDVFIFRTQKTVNIKAELFGVKSSTNNSMSDFAWHGPGTFYMSVFTRRHGFHIGVPKQWNGGHVAVPNQSCGRWTIFFCKRFLLFQKICIDTGHVSENAQ